MIIRLFSAGALAVASLAPALAAFGMGTAAPSAPVADTGASDDLTLTGTWEMDSAYEILADGTRTTNYGAHPMGLLTVDSAGRYNMQIFRIGRPVFASGDKARGTTDEYKQAVLGSSTHFGTVTIDRVRHRLVFNVRAASFPNWEGRLQVRDYSFKDGLLSYAVPASASSSGVVAYSQWRRVSKN